MSTLIGRQLTWQTNIRLSELVGDIRQSASHVKGGDAPAKRGANYGRFACTKILIEFASEMLTLLWNAFQFLFIDPIQCNVQGRKEEWVLAVLPKNKIYLLVQQFPK